MAATDFRDKERDYLEWVRHNPNGFVLNTDHNSSFKHTCCVHRATCTSIIRPAANAKRGRDSPKEGT